MSKRMIVARDRMEELFAALSKEKLSTDEKIQQLSQELARELKEPKFLQCTTMGEIVRKLLYFTLRQYEDSSQK